MSQVERRRSGSAGCACNEGNGYVACENHMRLLRKRTMHAALSGVHRHGRDLRGCYRDFFCGSGGLFGGGGSGGTACGGRGEVVCVGGFLGDRVWGGVVW